MKCWFILLYTIASSYSSFSQTIDTAALKNYPPSVLARVYDVAVRVSLTSSEQTLVADLFTDEEHDVAALVRTGATLGVIDSVRRAYLSEFNSLLSTTKLQAFYSAKTSAKANTMARLTASMLQNKYNIDATTKEYFSTMYNWRESTIEELWLKSADTTIRNNNLAAVMYAYDTLISKYINASAGARFYAGKTFYIDSILAIPEAKKTALAESYYALCMQYKYRSYADNFNNAFNNVFNNVSDTPYYAIAYGPEIEQTIKTASQAIMSGYIKNYSLSPIALNNIKPYLYGRERATALINKVYPAYTSEKDEAITVVYNVFQPPIDSIVNAEINLPYGSQIDVALHFSEQLELSEDAIGALQASKAELNILREEYRQTDPVGEYDSRAFESEALNSILTADQYTQVLTAKYYGRAKSMADIDWKEIVKYQMHTEYDLDSTATKAELLNYHLSVFIAYYRNGNNEEEQHLSVQRINEVMPDNMRRLLDRWEYLTPYADTPDVFFQW